MKLQFTILALSLLILGAGCVNTNPQTGDAALDLHGLGLKSVPEYVFNITSLEELNLEENDLTGALPAEIRQLKNLRFLDVSSNRMTGVPAEIGQLSKLEGLDYSNNELTGLPMELGNLQNLERLDLRGNEISKEDLEQIRSRLPKTDILID